MNISYVKPWRIVQRSWKDAEVIKQCFSSGISLEYFLWKATCNIRFEETLAFARFKPDESHSFFHLQRTQELNRSKKHNMFGNIIFKKYLQSHDISHSKDVIARDITKTTLIDFLKKTYRCFLSCIIWYKIIIFFTKVISWKPPHFSIQRGHTRVTLTEKSHYLRAFFHPFHAISLICAPSCELLLHNAQGIGSYNIFERLVPTEYEHCADGIWSWVCNSLWWTPSKHTATTSSKTGVFLFSNIADVRYSVFGIRLRVRDVWVYMIDWEIFTFLIDTSQSLLIMFHRKEVIKFILKLLWIFGNFHF